MVNPAAKTSDASLSKELEGECTMINRVVRHDFDFVGDGSFTKVSGCVVTQYCL